MYSPRISEDLIPRIYQVGKARNKPMTRVVDEILRDYLDRAEIHEERVEEMQSGPVTKYRVAEEPQGGGNEG